MPESPDHGVKIGLSEIVAATGVIAVVTWILAIHWGAQSKDVMIGVSTGRLTGVVISLAFAVEEHSREERLRAMDNRRASDLHDMDVARADELRRLDQERAAELRRLDQERSQQLRNADEERAAKLLAEEVRFMVTTAPSIRGADLTEKDLRGIVFSGKDLRDTFFSGSQLQGANFNDCQLAGAYFVDADLTGAHFDRANLDGARLQSATMVGVSARSTSFVNVFLNEETDFTDADFRTSARATAGGTTFQGAHMCAGNEDLPENPNGKMKASGSRYDGHTEWPSFQGGPPGDAIPDRDGS